MKQFILTNKKKLTNDVFELDFKSSESVDHIPWQFITFILDGIGGRSYSLLSSKDLDFKLIIKRVADGKKGSIYLCDSLVWAEFKWVGPVWKFVLHNEHTAKLFAGTGTWLVPLYNQIVKTLESGNSSKITLLFWVRTSADIFYIENFKSLKEKYPNFDYKVALSREENDEYHTWYITDFVDENMAWLYNEAYLCWAPVVVDSMQEKLVMNNFNIENIFTEKY